jgi:hypothetical protein
LGQTLTIEAEGTTHVVKLPLIGAYQAANALTAAGLLLGTGSALKDILSGAGAGAAGARAAGARGDQQGGRAHLCRLCAYAGRAGGGDRGAAAACAGG